MVRLERLDGVGMSHRVEDRPLPGFDAALTPIKRRRRRVLVSLFIMLVLAAGATWFFQPSWLNYLDQPITFWDDSPGYTRYIAHDNEWTLRFPDNWHAFHIAEHPPRRGRRRPATYGVLVSNVKISEWELWAEGMPAKLVAVRVAFDHSGGLIFEGYCDHDTPLPLRLSNASSSDARVRDDVRGNVRAFYLPFAVERIGLYSVRAWIGSQASKADRAIVEQIVGSIRYPDHSMSHVQASGCPIEDQLKKLGGKVS
jgi:hypothetical protein